MSRILKSLVLVQLILSVGALVLALDLFEKRNALKYRVLRFESFAQELEAVLEDGAVDGNVLAARDLPRDDSDYAFWQDYLARDGADLEARSGHVKLAVDARALKNPYLRDPDIPELIMRDPDLGTPIIGGPGTMDAELDRIAALSREQYERLNDTRELLSLTRRELEDRLLAYNSRYDALQVQVAANGRLGETIASLNKQLKARDTQIAKQTGEIESLNVDLRDQRDEIAGVNERLKNEKARHRLTHDELVYVKDHYVPRNGGPVTPPVNEQIAFGEKGTVSYVDGESHFVVLDAPDTDLTAGTILLTHRADGVASDTPTARLRVAEVRESDGRVVADVMRNWALAANDIAVY